MAALLTNLGKFSGNDNMDLSTWLKGFDRCCAVLNKGDDVIKGQLLMLSVEGQAKAVLEEVEEQHEAPQRYSDSVRLLKARFNTIATREASMVEFETRTQQLEESEDEFMLVLSKLYRFANPEQNAVAQEASIKRKFLQGIAPERRRGLFVFCNNPYDVNVTRTQLLDFCRNARLHLAVTPPETSMEA